MILRFGKSFFVLGLLLGCVAAQETRISNNTTPNSFSSPSIESNSTSASEESISNSSLSANQSTTSLLSESTNEAETEQTSLADNTSEDTTISPENINSSAEDNTISPTVQLDNEGSFTVIEEDTNSTLNNTGAIDEAANTNSSSTEEDTTPINLPASSSDHVTSYSVNIASSTAENNSVSTDENLTSGSNVTEDGISTPSVSDESTLRDYFPTHDQSQDNATTIGSNSSTVVGEAHSTVGSSSTNNEQTTGEEDRDSTGSTIGEIRDGSPSVSVTNNSQSQTDLHLNVTDSSQLSTSTTVSLIGDISIEPTAGVNDNVFISTVDVVDSSIEMRSSTPPQTQTSLSQSNSTGLEVVFTPQLQQSDWSTNKIKKQDPNMTTDFNNIITSPRPDQNNTTDTGFPELEAVEGESNTSLAFVKAASSPIDLQTQIYIISGTLGGILLLLILVVLALALSISRLKDQIERQRYTPVDANAAYGLNARGARPPEQIHAYDNSAFNGAHEMEERRPDSKAEIDRLGYEMYNGKDKRYSTGGPIPRADRISRDSHQLRLEDSVVPMGPTGGSTDRREYRKPSAGTGNDRYRY